MLGAVGLDPDTARNRRPHEFSGGQCQRISIARAVITDPKLIICDEPVSALDVSVQAQILNLLEEMKQRYELTMLFIAHDLAVVKNVSDRVAVMYLGKLCEIGAPDQLYAQPGAPVHRRAARRDPRARSRRHRPTTRRVLGGEIPSNIEPAERLPVPHPLPEGRRSGARRRSPRCATSGPSSTWRATSRSRPASSSTSPVTRDGSSRIFVAPTAGAPMEARDGDRGDRGRRTARVIATRPAPGRTRAPGAARATSR